MVLVRSGLCVVCGVCLVGREVLFCVECRLFRSMLRSLVIRSLKVGLVR